jgi:hypothetical protein
MAKKMLVLTGPQGAGNHLWSKIFSLHPEVYGWKSLLDNYWEAHRYAEPFAECWKNLDLLKEFDWTQSDYYFTSISVPLGIGDNKWAPDIEMFVRTLMRIGISPELVVCGRDKNILQQQQTRLRSEYTTPMLLEAIKESFISPKFVSYELLQLYRQDYLKTLDFSIPVDWNDPRIDTILADDSNAKYVHYVDEYFLDDCNKTGLPLKEKP